MVKIKIKGRGKGKVGKCMEYVSLILLLFVGLKRVDKGGIGVDYLLFV